MAVKEIERWEIKRGYLSSPFPARSSITTRRSNDKKSCHKFWLQKHSAASRKKRNCCTCGGFSRGSALKAEKGRQRRGWSFWCQYQELTIKAPPEVEYLFSDSEGKPARYVRLMKSFYGLTSAPRAWWLDITQKLSQLGWKPMSTFNVCGVVILMVMR